MDALVEDPLLRERLRNLHLRGAWPFHTCTCVQFPVLHASTVCSCVVHDEVSKTVCWHAQSQPAADDWSSSSSHCVSPGQFRRAITRSGLDLQSTLGIHAYLHVLSLKKRRGNEVHPKLCSQRMTELLGGCVQGCQMSRGWRASWSGARPAWQTCASCIAHPPGCPCWSKPSGTMRAPTLSSSAQGAPF